MGFGWPVKVAIFKRERAGRVSRRVSRRRRISRKRRIRRVSRTRRRVSRRKRVSRRRSRRGRRKSTTWHAKRHVSCMVCILVCIFDSYHINWITWSSFTSVPNLFPTQFYRRKYICWVCCACSRIMKLKVVIVSWVCWGFYAFTLAYTYWLFKPPLGDITTCPCSFCFLPTYAVSFFARYLNSIVTFDLTTSTVTAFTAFLTANTITGFLENLYNLFRWYILTTFLGTSFIFRPTTTTCVLSARRIIVTYTVTNQIPAVTFFWAGYIGTTS